MQPREAPKPHGDSQKMAEAAYNAYRDAVGGKSAVTGAPLPDWSTQSPEIQAGWLAAAEKVATMAHDNGRRPDKKK